MKCSDAKVIYKILSRDEQLVHRLFRAPQVQAGRL
jgi:hypothetical protein